MTRTLPLSLFFVRTFMRRARYHAPVHVHDEADGANCCSPRAHAWNAHAQRHGGVVHYGRFVRREEDAPDGESARDCHCAHLHARRFLHDDHARLDSGWALVSASV